MKKILSLFLLLITVPALAVSSLTATIEAKAVHRQTLAGALGTSRDQSQVGFSQDFDSGTRSTAADVDTLYYAQRSLANGSSETLDLAGSLTNGLGETVSFARIKGLYVKNLSESHTLTMGGGSWGSYISPATATIYIPPSGGRNNV